MNFLTRVKFNSNTNKTPSKSLQFNNFANSSRTSFRNYTTEKKKPNYIENPNFNEAEFNQSAEAYMKLLTTPPPLDGEFPEDTKILVDKIMKLSAGDFSLFIRAYEDTFSP